MVKKFEGEEEFRNVVSCLGRAVNAFFEKERPYLLIVEQEEGSYFSTGNSDFEWQLRAMESGLEGVQLFIDKGYTTEADVYPDGSD